MAGEHNLKNYEENPKKLEWCNLPPDLLRSIIAKLYFADRVRLRSVCKDWHNIPVGDRPINELPWVMSYADFNINYSRSTVMLSYPVNKKKIEAPNSKGIFYIDKGYNSIICASKCGWVLLTISISDALFLYSPFRNNLITLPTPFTKFGSYFPCDYQVTFSYPKPMSPFYVFVIARFRDPAGLRFFTYHYGDSEWRIKSIDAEYTGWVNSLLYNEKGICYFVLQCGKLGAFCVESQECTWLVNSAWDFSGDRMYLVQFKGELLLAKCSTAYDDCKVFRYDLNKRGWIRQKTLGGGALFVSNSISFIRTAIGDTSYLADKIVCKRYDDYKNKYEIRLYSLKERKLCQKSLDYIWMVNDSPGNFFIEPPYYQSD